VTSPGRPNVLLTGGPGVGKSTLIEEIIVNLKKLNQDLAAVERQNALMVYDSAEQPQQQPPPPPPRIEPRTVVVTAYTGVAALNINGCTVHTWAGLGINMDETVPNLVAKVNRVPETYARWTLTGTLIMDECSMLTGLHLDKLNAVARQVRKNDLPFGGIQLIAVGDFCQLSPVTVERDGHFFEAQCFMELFGSRLYELNEIFRTKDSRLSSIIKNLREGCVTSGQMNMLKSKVLAPDAEVPKDATVLFPTKREVRSFNANKLAHECEGPYAAFISMDCVAEDSQRDQIMRSLNQLIVARSLVLRKGAAVMLLKNYAGEDLANGSTGIVQGLLRVPLSMWNGWATSIWAGESVSSYAPKGISVTPQGAPLLSPQDKLMELARAAFPGIHFNGLLMNTLPSVRTNEMNSMYLPTESVPAHVLPSVIDNVRIIDPPRAPTASAKFKLVLSAKDDEDDSKYRQQQQRPQVHIPDVNLQVETDSILLPVVTFPPLRGALMEQRRKEDATYIVGPIAYEISTYVSNNDAEAPQLVKKLLGCRYQVPLALVWASTIHKVQGLTLPRVHADIGRNVFAPGMALVAISRTSTWEGLTLKSFAPAALGRVDPKVKEIMSLIRKTQERRETRKRRHSDDEGDDDEEERKAQRAGEDSDEEDRRYDDVVDE
jgi:hypothetical protein